jgi:hypothetical protein
MIPTRLSQRAAVNGAWLWRLSLSGANLLMLDEPTNNTRPAGAGGAASRYSATPRRSCWQRTTAIWLALATQVWVISPNEARWKSSAARSMNTSPPKSRAEQRCHRNAEPRTETPFRQRWSEGKGAGGAGLHRSWSRTWKELADEMDEHAATSNPDGRRYRIRPARTGAGTALRSVGADRRRPGTGVI